MMKFIPLHLSPLARSPKLQGWIESWAPKDMIILKPEDWDVRGHDIVGGTVNEEGIWLPTIKKGTYLWNIPPAAASAVIKELRKARIKYQDSLHIVLIPGLLTPKWQKQLFKVADLIVWIPPCLEHWPANMYEPCCLAFLFPFLNSFPSQLRGMPKLMATRRKLPRRWKEDQMDGRDFLHKFLLECRQLQTIPSSSVQSMLYFGRNNNLPQGTRSKDES